LTQLEALYEKPPRYRFGFALLVIICALLLLAGRKRHLPSTRPGRA
jgi:hypothetical protein